MRTRTFRGRLPGKGHFLRIELEEAGAALILIDPTSNDGFQKSQIKFIFSWKVPIFDNSTPQKEPQFDSRRNKFRRSFFASNILSQRTIQLFEQFLVAEKPLIIMQFGAPTQKPETFPKRVAILPRGIKRTHSGFAPMHQPPVDLDEKIGVGRILVM